jgi:hypothetical protein
VTTTPIELEEGLYAHLIKQPNIAGLVAGRVFGVGAEGGTPQSVTDPRITYQRIGTSHDKSFGGANGYAEARVQVDSWAGTQLEAQRIATQVRLALDTFSGPFVLPDGSTIDVSLIEIVNDVPMPDSPTERVPLSGRVMQEYLISFFETTP